MQPNKADKLITKLIHLRIFPSGYKAKLGLGLWWIIEPFLIELPIAGFFFSKYDWEILGVLNLGLFFSTLFAVVYGALCLGAGYVQLQFEVKNKRTRFLAQVLMIAILLIVMIIAYTLSQQLPQP